MYVLPIVVTPILSRLYSPYSFGEWGVFSSVVSIVTIVMFLSLENTIVKAEETELGNILALCCVVGMTVVGVFFASVCLLAPLMQGGSFLFDIRWVLLFYLIAYSFYIVAYNIGNRYGRYSSLATSNVIQGATQGTMRILFGVMPLVAVNGLVLGTTFAQTATAAFLVFAVWSMCRSNAWAKISVEGMRGALSKYRKFPLYDAPSNLLAFSTLNLPTIILAGTYSKASIGCFSIVLQLLLMPMSLVGSAMGKVYYQELCQAGSDSEKAQSVSASIISVLLFVSVLPLLAICCGGDRLVVMFLGKDWTDAGVVALLLALWSFPVILTQPVLPLFRVCNKQDVLLIYDLAYFAGGIGCIFACCRLGLPMHTALLSYSVVCAAVKFALFHKIARLTHFSMRDHKLAIAVWTLALCLFFIRLLFI